MISEEEAQEKVCPMGVCQSGYVQFQPACCASKCMAWRWGGEREVGIYEGKMKRSKVGFCGLAGKEQ